MNDWIEGRYTISGKVWFGNGCVEVEHRPTGIDIEIGPDGEISGGCVEYLNEIELPPEIWKLCNATQRKLFKGSKAENQTENRDITP